MQRVLCAGHVNWDVTLFVDRLPAPDGESRITERRQSGGGSAANVAVALAGLDCAATLLGSVGDDDQGHLARRDLLAAAVDCTGLMTADGETTTKYLLVDDDGEVAVLGADGANEAVTPADVDPELVQAADHVHLTGQRPETAEYIADAAGEAGIPVSFDPGRRAADRDYDAVIDRADVLFLNEREATALGDSPDEGLTVTKYGTRGATLETADDFYGHPGFDLPGTDATGAGDAFAAGFLASRLRGDEPARALAVGNACGALAARKRGPKAEVSWRQVERVLDGENP